MFENKIPSIKGEMENLSNKSKEERENNFEDWVGTANKIDLQEALEDYKQELNEFDEMIRKSGGDKNVLSPLKEDGWPDMTRDERYDKLKKRIPTIQALLSGKENRIS